MPRLVRRTASAARAVASSVVTPARMQVVRYADSAPDFHATRYAEWQTTIGGTYRTVSGGILRHEVGPLRRLFDRVCVQRRSFIIYWR